MKKLEDGSWTNLNTGGPSEDNIRIHCMWINLAGLDINSVNAKEAADKIAEILPVLNKAKWGGFTTPELSEKILTAFNFTLRYKNYMEEDPTAKKISMEMIKPFYICYTAFQLARGRVKADTGA